MPTPVFFDPSGKRRRRSLAGVIALLVLIALAAVAFATTIVNVPTGAPLHLEIERPQSAPLAQRLAAIRHGIKHRLRDIGWLPRHPHAAAGVPLTVGFYVPWDDASRASLRAHLTEMNWVVPAQMSVTGPAHRLVRTPDAAFDAILAGSKTRPAVLPMVQNIAGGAWDGEGAAALFADPAQRARLIAAIGVELAQQRAAGVVFDFENLPHRAIVPYRALLKEARAAYAPHHWLVTATLPVGDEDWDARSFAAVTDKLFLMNYDEHWQGGEAGPIASQAWFVQQLRDAVAKAGRDKLILAFGSYAYDWHGGQADALTLEEAWLAAHDAGAVPRFDAASGNTGFAYTDDDGAAHQVWMLDAAATWNQLLATRASGLGAVALWRLGSEDPGVWADLEAWRAGTRPDLATIRAVGNVDVEGTGEVLRITATPTAGARAVAFDAAGLIRGERYDALPTPYVVQRVGGGDPRLLALTFDDGPDATWTPRILDVLERMHVPGTFFVIGENGLAHPLLLRRILAGGSEIGNHSYTHPNLAEVSPNGVTLELNATQRLIEAYTGRATRLFRAPYFCDAEPTTPDELGPALEAQRRGYTEVGLHVDPDDWKRPGVDQIVARAVDGVLSGGRDGSGNIILLHDAGGDRAQTVAALPRIIAALQAKGYRFVPVSTLIGLSRDQVMPRVAGADLAAVRVDVGVFAALAGLSWLLTWLFFVAITLGIGRAVLMAALALWNRWTDRDPPPAIDPARRITVIIPAFNEERVIEASVARVLDSRDVDLDVIVVDDGSTDRTSAIVAAAFGDNPRVRLITLANGGKATALNRALAEAGGEIVVALDADTQFEPDTVARLVRWFADPAIGAVAGNAKVGNRVNLVTRWQAVEYVTAQNVERRALSQFDAMTVVPGAVGAWRRDALASVGGYPEDTLAEDQDLTIAIQRAGWAIAYDVDAVAWTEAPERFGALAKQRFRWAYGTLQCLWKHRGVVRSGKPAGLAFVGLPQAWMFQIVFAAISPVIDLALLLSVIATAIRVEQHGWAQTQSDVLTMAVYWIAFTAIDVVCGWIAYRLEPRERRYPAHLLVAQRFVYRQLMYWVVLRAIASALAGMWIGWGKLERTGRVAGRA